MGEENKKLKLPKKEMFISTWKQSEANTDRDTLYGWLILNGSVHVAADNHSLSATSRTQTSNNTPVKGDMNAREKE